MTTDKKTIRSAGYDLLSNQQFRRGMRPDAVHEKPGAVYGAESYAKVVRMGADLVVAYGRAIDHLEALSCHDSSYDVLIEELDELMGNALITYLANLLELVDLHVASGEEEIPVEHLGLDTFTLQNYRESPVLEDKQQADVLKACVNWWAEQLAITEKEKSNADQA